jgi:small-conductance mechanosensitive channel
MIKSIILTFNQYIYQFGSLLVLLLIGFSIGYLIKRISKKILKEIGLDKKLKKIGYAYYFEDKIATLLSYIVYIITILSVLKELGITSIVLYLIFGGILVLIFLTLLIGIKDSIPDLIAWNILRKNKKIKINKKIKTDKVSGKITKIGIFETRIKTEKEEILYLPNSLLLKAIRV